MNRDAIVELLIGISEHDEDLPIDELTGTWAAQLDDVAPAEAQNAVDDWFADSPTRRITSEDVLASVRIQRGPAALPEPEDPWATERRASWAGGDSLAALRQAAEQRPCPYCDAAIGEPCVNNLNNGQPTRIPHSPRTGVETVATGAAA